MDSAQNDDILARLSALTERHIAEIERLQNQPRWVPAVWAIAFWAVVILIAKLRLL